MFVRGAPTGGHVVSFLTILMVFKFYTCRLAMESVRVLLDMKSFSAVSFFWTDLFERFSREAIIFSPIIASVALLVFLVKSPPLVSFCMSC